MFICTILRFVMKTVYMTCKLYYFTNLFCNLRIHFIYLDNSSEFFEGNQSQSPNISNAESSFDSLYNAAGKLYVCNYVHITRILTSVGYFNFQI